ncbi:unnamed protein product [Miscanthus lutarioriparius]|uniref:RRM domain-containing protein n=1 Tax=Miscanthus lutarioriparius TaxID=422564 RepID=A0A811RP02_9POAL|nr:unnamed protein product [Miscanthus lutarioriparius]
MLRLATAAVSAAHGSGKMKASAAGDGEEKASSASSPLQVKYANGELERLEHKLFVGMLPKNVTDAEMTDLFSKYGNIKDLQILRGSQQTSKPGCAFLKYETKEQAVAAIEALNGTYKIEGSSVPLVVKWADTEKERQARKAQKAQFQSSNMLNANAMQQNSVFGALQMGYVPQYNGFGYQPQGTYRLMQYPPHLLCKIKLPSRIWFSLLIKEARSVELILNFPLIQFLDHLILHSWEAPIRLCLVLLELICSYITFRKNLVTMILANAFHSFGRVLSAKVFVDKATGVRKCFGN